MNSKFFLMLIICFSFTISEMSAQINFYTNNSEAGFANVFRIAKNSNKVVMIDCYTDWCGWCKKYDTNAFANAAVGEYANEHFVSYKLDMETPLGVAVAEAIDVNSFPTILWFTPEGKIIKRLNGYRNSTDFLSICQGVYNAY
jgi:thioredoxin-related protein